jgi:membrane protease YdiL (CAAX protease family)
VALFGIGHLYQGRRGMTSTFLLGVILASARAWTGSLVPGFAAHFAVDLIAGLVAPRALRAARPNAVGQ